MPIKFTNFEEAKKKFAAATQEGTPEEQSQALSNMLESLANDVRADVMKEANEIGSDKSILQSRGFNVLTSEETKFFNAVIEEGGFKETDTLPKTTQERVFEDLVKEHPLLREIGIRNLGAVTEFIYGDPEGASVWGDLFGEIKGKLNATFRKEKIEQLKLTAFIPIANDMLSLGPVWVERYVRTMIREAMSVGLEKGFVAGDGQSMPIGLMYQKESNGAVVQKTSSGTLTFEPGRTMINEMAGVIKKLSTYFKHDDSEEETPMYRKVAGKIVMVVNPFDNVQITANATIQNANGVYITSMPYSVTIVESTFVPEGKAIFFLRDQYIAAIGGAMTMRKFEETLAMEDATLYISKQFATGKPVDKYAAKVYDLNLVDEEVPEP